MFLSEQEHLDIVITALQSVAAYPDAGSVEELQGVLRQRLATIPVPRHHPAPVEIVHQPYRPPNPPPSAWPNELPPQFADAAPICTCICIASLPVLCTVAMTNCFCWILFTGFTLDEFGRPLCFQFQEFNPYG
jgi:hypothetical protein